MSCYSTLNRLESIAIFKDGFQYNTEETMGLCRNTRVKVNANVEGYVDVKRIQIITGALLDVRLPGSSIDPPPEGSFVDFKNGIALIDLESTGLDTWLRRLVQHGHSKIHEAICETKAKESVLVVQLSPFSYIKKDEDRLLFHYRGNYLPLPLDASAEYVDYSWKLKMPWKSLEETFKRLWDFWSHIFKFKVREQVRFSRMFYIRLE
jgi:hypothetical protein